MRTKNASINVLTGVVGQFLILLLSFITRTVFIKYLSVDYLGLNGLFSNILTIFSLANMGIGTAITFSLYRPIAENDNEKIIYLYRLLKKSYYLIGTIILLLGLLLIPFLDVVVKGSGSIDNLTFIYLIFLFNYIFPYFYGFAYRSVATAHQKEYLYSSLNTAAVILADIVRILLIPLTRSYMLYLLISTIFNILMFITLKYFLYSKFKYLKDKTNYQIKVEEKDEIIKNIKGAFLYNFGFVIVNGTDNILFSTFLGVKYLGYFTNYQYIIGAIQTILRQIFSSLIASIGNLHFTSTTEKKIDIFYVILLANFWFFSFSSIALYILIDPFINLWLGADFIINKSLTTIIIIIFYLTGIQGTSNAFRSAMGLFWYGRYRPVLSALVNLIFSLILVQTFGAEGIFLGTLLSILFVDIWYEPVLVFNRGFKKSSKVYFKKLLLYTFVTILVGFIVYLTTLLVKGSTVVDFIYLVLICLILPNAMFYLIFKKTKEFKYIENYLRKTVLSIINH